MTQFERADGKTWLDDNEEWETLARAGALLYWHKDELSEPQTERLNRITQRLGEIVIERREGGYRE